MTREPTANGVFLFLFLVGALIAAVFAGTAASGLL
jgi:hypothetical protein